MKTELKYSSREKSIKRLPETMWRIRPTGAHEIDAIVNCGELRPKCVLRILKLWYYVPESQICWTFQFRWQYFWWLDICSVSIKFRACNTYSSRRFTKTCLNRWAIPHGILSSLSINMPKIFGTESSDKSPIPWNVTLPPFSIQL